MGSSFEIAVLTVLRHEGGYINNPNDPGEATKYGISLRWLKSQGLLKDPNEDMKTQIEEIQALTVDQAEGFYRVKWWDQYGFGRILDQTLGTKVFDTAVNCGTPRAVRFVQQAVNALGRPLVTPDGQLGPQTVERVNSAVAGLLLHKIQDIQADYYRGLALNPRLACFLGGWLNRAYDRN